MDLTFEHSPSRYAEIIVALYYPTSKQILTIGISKKGIDQLLNNSSKYIVGVWRIKQSQPK